MRRTLGFLIVLAVILGGLAWTAVQVVNKTTEDWFERDVALRAELAVRGLRRTFQDRLEHGDVAAIKDLLEDVSRDERVTAAAVCIADHRMIAATGEFPADLTCAALEGLQPLHSSELSRMIQERDNHRMQISILPLGGQPAPAVVILLQDLTFADRRASMARSFLVLAFLVLAVCGSVVAIVAARLSWRGWSDELRNVLRTGRSPSRFNPLVRDVRELVDRLSSELDIEGLDAAWTPERLRRVLGRYLQGERLVVVANREPYIHEKLEGGGVGEIHPASGLVTALEPVMRACSGVWVAHGSGTADREAADRDGRLGVPTGDPSYILRRIWLTDVEERGYYYGTANDGLWPLCHMAHTRPNFRIDDWKQYQLVNKRFADAACAEVDSDDAIILVQDYHFALVPRLIRERMPRATIIAFWHIPWPNAERFGMCPWRDEILEGLLGSSIVGLHTQLHCNNFVDAVDRYLEARLDREISAVVHRRRATLVRPYPISVEWPPRWASGAPSAPECRAAVFRELGLGPQTLLGVGVDRLDYTKGIEERLLAVERLLERFPRFVGRFVFVQLAAPSRTFLPRYALLNDAVEELAARINSRFGRLGYRPIVLLRSHHEPPEVFRYYRAADCCFVSSLHDGMNLVAKEFVAAREDEQGVLVLSQFTGAARELTEALIVNPYDLEETSAALAVALEMPPHEQRARMRFMRSVVREFNVYRWAGRMLFDAARLRRHDRLVSDLREHPRGAGGLT